MACLYRVAVFHGAPVPCNASKGKLGTKVLETLYCTVRRLVRIANLSQFDLVVIHREVFPFWRR